MSKTKVYPMLFMLLAWLNGAWAQAIPTQAMRKGDFVAASEGFATDSESHRADHEWVLDAARMALYDNRLDEAERLYRQLAGDAKLRDRTAAGLAAIAERRGENSTFVIEQIAPRVEIPFEASRPLPVIQVTLGGGHIARFLIDTGAPGIVVDPALAAELGWPVEEGGVGVFGGGGRGPMRHTVVPQLEMPGLTVRRIPAMVMPMAGAPAPDGMKVDGIVGTAFFYHFLTTIDFKHERLILQQRESSASFQKTAAAEGAFTTRMWYVPDHFVFARARINGKADGLYHIDTGGTGFGMQATLKTVRAAGIALDRKNPGHFLTPGGDVKTLPFVADVAFGGSRVKASGVYFPKGDQYGIFPFEVAGTLSEGIFRRGALTFDFVAMRLVFRND